MGLAGGSAFLGARDKSIFAAKDGINVIASFGNPGPSSESDIGALPKAAKSYSDTATDVAAVWAGFDAAMTGVAAASGIVQGVVDPGFPWSSVTHITQNLVATGLNIASLATDRDIALPGINLYSTGGTYQGALYGSVNLGGGAGFVMGSLFHTQLAYATVKLRGGRRTSLSACGPLDVSSILWHEGKSDNAQVYACRLGDLTFDGATITVGKSTAVYPQIPTVTVTATALNSVALVGQFRTKIGALDTIKFTALTDLFLEATSPGAAAFKVGPWEVSCKPAGATIGGATAGVSFKPMNVCAKAGAATVKSNGVQVEMKAGAGSLVVIPGSLISVDGIGLDIG
ncbi:MAG: hypothetical protein AB8I08_07395 [Sandaracinaceae bacterium]